MSVVTRNMKKRGILIAPKETRWEELPPEDTRWEDLVPEMLQRILKYVNNKTDLLTCRLVNSAWKESATLVIQKQSLGTLTNWKGNTLNPTSFPKGFTTLFPSVVIIKPNWEVEQQHLAAPSESGINLVSTGQDNPIITNSLRVIGRRRITSKPSDCFRASEMFETHGSTLTSLSLEDITVDPKQAIKILCHLDNLVALNLDSLHYAGPNKDMNSKWESYLPNLTHLTCNTGGWMGPWLLQHVASQLVSLTCGNHISPYYEDLPLVFDKLKELRFYFTNKEVIVTGIRAPILERLSLKGFYKWVTFRDCMEFISQFASTLIEFELNDCFDLTSSGGGDCGRVSFPKMMAFTFTLRLRHREGFDNPVNWQYLKTLFLSRFPNLKSLNLIFRSYDKVSLRKETACALLQSHDIWNFCPELMIVQIKHVQYHRNLGSCVRFTREELG